MTRQRLLGTLGVTVGVVTFAAWPALAGQEGARTNSSGASSGTAVSRGGDSGGGSAVSRGGDSGGGSTSSGGGGGMSTGSSSMGSSSVPSTWSSFEAPSRSSDQGARPRGGASSSGTAVPRSSGGGNGGGSSSVSRGSGSRDASASAEAPTRRAVPAYSRPRGDRPVTGTAVDRASIPPPDGGNIIVIPPYPYYPPSWGFWGPGYGYGLGYLYYDPFWYGGFGYGMYGGYGGYGGSGGYAISESYKEEGSLRLKIGPRHAQVYIDGYYVGVVDSFDGAFQKLNLDGGAHRVEIKADGYAPLEFEVMITPGETVIYKGEMKRMQ